MFVLGIDSDSKGSIAVLDYDKVNRIARFDCYPIFSEVHTRKNGANHTLIDGSVLYGRLKTILLSANEKMTYIFVEEQWGRPGSDSARAFTFAQNYGTILGVIESLRYELGADTIRLTLVHSKTWKAAFKITKDKAGNITWVNRLFNEDCSQCWDRTSMHMSAAEAALISFWGLSSLKLPLSPGKIRAMDCPILNDDSSMLLLKKKKSNAKKNMVKMA
jgi:hypothetical protein